MPSPIPRTSAQLHGLHQALPDRRHHRRAQAATSSTRSSASLRCVRICPDEAILRQPGDSARCSSGGAFKTSTSVVRRLQVVRVGLPVRRPRDGHAQEQPPLRGSRGHRQGSRAAPVQLDCPYDAIHIFPATPASRGPERAQRPLRRGDQHPPSAHRLPRRRGRRRRRERRRAQAPAQKASPAGSPLGGPGGPPNPGGGGGDGGDARRASPEEAPAAPTPRPRRTGRCRRARAGRTIRSWTRSSPP